MDVFARPATHAQAARTVIDCSSGTATIDKAHQSASNYVNTLIKHPQDTISRLPEILEVFVNAGVVIRIKKQSKSR